MALVLLSPSNQFRRAKNFALQEANDAGEKEYQGK